MGTHLIQHKQTTVLDSTYICLQLVVARFSPGFGRSPNPGQASDSKPRGGSVKASMGV